MPSAGCENTKDSGVAVSGAFHCSSSASSATEPRPTDRRPGPALRRRDLVPDDLLDNAQPPLQQLDVLPSQPEQFTAPQARGERHDGHPAGRLEPETLVRRRRRPRAPGTRREGRRSSRRRRLGLARLPAGGFSTRSSGFSLTHRHRRAILNIRPARTRWFLTVFGESPAAILPAAYRSKASGDCDSLPRSRSVERGAEVVPQRRLVVDDRRLLPRPGLQPHLDELVRQIGERPAPWLAHPLLDRCETSTKRPLRLPPVPLGLRAQAFPSPDVRPRRRTSPSRRHHAAPRTG